MQKYFLIIFLILIQFVVGNNNNNPKIGLVLSGGGAKGFAHIGALKILDSLNIPIDYIVGTSIGAIAGAMYSVGYSADEIEQTAKDTDWEAMFTDQVPRRDLPYFEKNDFGKYQLEFRLKKVKPVQPNGFIQGQSSQLELNKIFSNYNSIQDFSQFHIPFKCIATDVVTGNEVIIDKGVLPKALRASLSIPTVFAPVEWGDSLLIDGGVINNLPTNIIKDMGADIIIAVDVGTPMKNKSQLTGIIEIMEQAMGILEYKREEKNLKLVDILIKPDMSKYKNSDFSKGKINGMVKKGKEASVKIIPELMELKNGLFINSKLDFKTPKKLESVNINKVIVNGLNKTSKSFFLRVLGIGDKPITIEKLNKKIQSVYGLGYFKIIEYYFEESIDNTQNLIINTIEQPRNKLRFGIKWDHENQLIVSSNVQFSNIPFSGFRLENTFNFGGIRKNTFSVYYPSKGLNYPFYPFIRIIDSWEPITKINESGHKTGVLNLYDQFISLGFGTTVGNYWITELNYKVGLTTLDSEIGDFENLNILFENQFYDIFSFDLKLDNLDNNLSPKRGVNFSMAGDYSNKFGQYQFFNYNSFLDTYLPINKHSWRNLIYFNFINGSKIPYPQYQFKMDEYFHAGILKHGLLTDKLIGGRTEFIYEFKYDIFLHFYYNPIFHAKYKSLETNYLHAGGLMLQLKSPLGPINLTWSYSPKSLFNNFNYTSNFYLSAGYEF